MASHVPFLAVRPDDQFSTEVKTRDFATTNGIPPSSDELAAMDGTEAPVLPLPRASRLPSWVRFPVAMVMSLSISAFAYTLVADWAGLEMASVSRDLHDEWQIAAVLGWKVVSLTAAWVSGYDWLDLTALTFLSNLPYYYLLNTFYVLHDEAVIPALLIDTVSVMVPFFLFRGIPSRSDKKLQKQSSRAVAYDWQILVLVTIFGSAIYALTVYTSFWTWLPVYMIEHFENLRSIGQARESNILLQLAATLPAGVAATTFLFVPAVTASNKLLKALDPITAKADFDSENSNLAQTVAYNLGFGSQGFSARSQVLAKRTTALAVSTFINTFVRVYGTIEGSELVGALGWSSLWAVASVLTGVAFGWVADE